MDIGDPRIEFVADYILKTMKLRPERWQRMYSSEESKQMCLEFFDKTDKLCLVFSVTITGVLTVSYTWPISVKTKCVYFIKKGYEALPRDGSVKQKMVYGDLGYSPIDQLSSFVEEVSNFTP